MYSVGFDGDIKAAAGEACRVKMNRWAMCDAEQVTHHLVEIF